MSGIPFGQLPVSPEPLDADEIILCRDGVVLKRFTLGEIKDWIWSKLVGSVEVLSYNASLDWDMNFAYMFKVTLTGNTVLQAPINLKPGTWIMYVKQDAVGGRTMNFQAPIYRGPRGLLPILSTLPNAVDILTFVSDGVKVDVNIQANLQEP